MKTQINCTSKDIKPLIRKHSKSLKHVHYNIFVRPFLPTQDNRGFEVEDRKAAQRLASQYIGHEGDYPSQSHTASSYRRTTAATPYSLDSW